jgi:hypothetical protein
LNSPDCRGGGGFGGSRDLVGFALLAPVVVCVRRGGGMNLLLVSVTREAGRDWSNDLRTGRSGGGTLCSCTLLRISKVSFSLRTGNAGRTSGISLGEGSGAACFD